MILPASVALAVVAATASLGFAGVFPRWDFAPALVGAAVLSVALTTGLSRTRLTRGVRAVIVAAAGYGYTAFAARASLPDVGRGLRDGWAQILDVTLPAPTRDGPMVTAVAIVWLTGSLAAAIGLTKRVVLPLLPPLVAFGAGLVFGVGGPALPGWVPVLLVAACGLYVVVRGGLAARTWPRLAGAAAVVGLAAAVVPAGDAHLPGSGTRDRYDVRELRDQPVEVSDLTNPLATLLAQLRSADNPIVFRARITGEDEYWRLAVLDSFDGTQWSSSTTFRRVGAELPPSALAVPSRRVTQEVRLEALEGRFLPAYEQPVRVGVDGIAADAEGVLVVPDDVDRPATYRVESLVPEYDVDRLQASAAVASGGRLVDPNAEQPLRAALEAAELPPGLSGAAKLQALADWFRTSFDYVIDDTAKPGHGIFHITRMLAERRGTAEQFASAFAALAIIEGYRARVVVGFQAGDRDRETGEVVVTSHHAHAWPEVLFEGVGWVTYEPSNLEQLRAAQPPTDREPIVVEPPPESVPTTVPPSTTPTTVDPSAEDSEEASGGGGRSMVFVVLLVVAGLGVVLAVVVAAIVAAKRRRVRRQREGSPAQQVAGAWAHALDRLSEAGVRVPPHLAATEVPAAAGVAGEALAGLAVIANANRFSDTPADAADADAAWSASSAVATAVRHSAGSPRAKLRQELSPAPLLRR